MNLSPHFTLAELTISQEAARAGLRNAPDIVQIDNLRALCVNVLEPLRARVKKPVVVTSGFRSVSVNRRIGGSRCSQHTRGEAADIIVPGMDSVDVFKLIRAMKLPFDQVIEEFGRWVHVSHKRLGPQRGSVLVAYSRAGETVYQKLA